MINMVRGGKTIQRNHANCIPRHILAVDTETLPEQRDPTGSLISHYLRLGVCIQTRLAGNKSIGQRVTRFHTQDEFWRVLVDLTRAQQTTWVVAHNMLFDFITLGLPARLERSEMTLDWPRASRSATTGRKSERSREALAVIESPPTIIACRIAETQGRVVFVDTMNWFHAPLKELGKSIGRLKMEMPPFEADDETWFQYCDNDCTIVLETFLSLIDWIRANDLGMFRYTAAAQAYAAYRHKYMPQEIHTHNIQEVRELERRSYFGGRTEVFRRGERFEKVYHVDVSSLFPSVMKAKVFPYTLEKYEVRKGYLALIPFDSPLQCIAQVVIDSDESVFPFRRSLDTIYPTGQYATVLAGPELAYALQRGIVRRVGSWAQYKLAPLFYNWVDELWQLRMKHEENGDNLYATFAKTLMNSLYGKFGQLAPQWLACPSEPVIAPWSKWVSASARTGEVTAYRSFGWTAQKKCGREEIEGTFPGIAAFVTSYARLRMNTFRRLAEPINCYYQAIDSLIVNQAGYDNLQAAGCIHKRTLGQLRLESSADYCNIMGFGDYIIGDKATVSGRSKRAYQDESGVWQQQTFHAKDKLFAGRSADCVDETTGAWAREGTYRKGCVGSDGWVSPLVLSMSEPPIG